MDAIVDDMLDMFPDTVLVQTPGTPDGFGADTPGTAVPRSAHVYDRIRQVVGQDGQMRQSSVTAVFAGAFDLTVNHVYTLPVRFVPRQPKALVVAKRTDENGAHHETVYF